MQKDRCTSTAMIKRIKRLKKIRLHREGTDTLLYGFIVLAAIALLLWRNLDNKIPFWFFVVVAVALYGVVVNFFRCPIRYFPQEDTENIVVAPADGRIVVIEEVDEDQYFHEKRLMISIFMSLFNVHANWFPVDGRVKLVHHQNGNYHKVASESKRGKRTCRHNHHYARRQGHTLPSDCRSYGTPNSHIRQRRRGMLHRRAPGIHQVRLTR